MTSQYHLRLHGDRARPAFTLLEVLISLMVLSGAGVLVAELGVWSLSERARADARLEAVDAAANVLEQARALPWKELTPQWASAQKLPDHLAVRWPDCRLSVRVEAEEKRPLVKRVTVEIKWTEKGRTAWTPITLTGFFSARTAEDMR